MHELLLAHDIRSVRNCPMLVQHDKSVGFANTIEI